MQCQRNVEIGIVSLAYFTSLLALTFHRSGERAVDSERHLDERKERLLELGESDK